MYSRDYLMRLISQTTAMLAQIMGLKEQKKHEEAMDLLDEFLNRELRMRTRLALGLSDEDLLQMLSVGGMPNLEQVAMVAVFLQEEGDILSETGRQAEAVPRYEKALRLMLYVVREGGAAPQLRLEERAEQLIRLLAPFEQTTETRRAVWDWRDRRGEWAEAENLLYELYDDGAATAAEGLAFYDRLAERDDAALEAGGLSRAELEEGRRQWLALTDKAAAAGEIGAGHGLRDAGGQ